jgi:hypothetical protein
MSSTDSIFVAVQESPEGFAAWLTEVLSLEWLDRASEEKVALRRRVSTGDGWIQFVVQRNLYESPEPDEVQAMDGYSVEIDLKAFPKDDSVLHREARLTFEQLTHARPDVGMLLCEELTILVGAHLPGRGTKYFGPEITVDVEDEKHWRPWIVGSSR